MSRGTIDVGSKTIPDTTRRGYLVTPIGDYDHVHSWGDWGQQGSPVSPISLRWHRKCHLCNEYESVEYYPEGRNIN